MIVRIVPYTEVFISATLSIDEAAALLDGLEVVAKYMPKDVLAVTEALRSQLEPVLQRAAGLQAKKEG